jgi:hypothetical protein
MVFLFKEVIKINTKDKLMLILILLFLILIFYITFNVLSEVEAMNYKEFALERVEKLIKVLNLGK